MIGSLWKRILHLKIIAIARYCAANGSTALIVRPGRLVGAPFTNFDLARLLQLDQKSNKGIVVGRGDSLSGDVERADVASMVRRVLESPLNSKELTFAMVNAPGDSPSESEWSALIGSLDRK